MFNETKAVNNNAPMVYACGGTGINITKRLKDVRTAYIDSSISNVDESVNEDNIYLISDMDGAGKDRSVTYNAFAEDVETVLIKHKPSPSVNVVISSLSGGTGSVVAPLLAMELIKQGHTVIVVAIATTSSTREIINSVGTLHTYNNIVEAVDKPIAMYYAGHHPNRGVVDDAVVSFIETLALITDKSRVVEFDNADMRNFVNYTGLDPMISIVRHSENKAPDFLKDKSQNRDLHVVSSILISDNVDTQIEGIVPEYAAGAIVKDTEGGFETLRLDATVGQMPLILAQLEARREELANELKSSKINKINSREGVKGSVMVF